MNSSEMILTTSILAMLESRDALREKIAQAFDGLRDAMSIEKRITGWQYPLLKVFWWVDAGTTFVCPIHRNRLRWR